MESLDTALRIFFVLGQSGLDLQGAFLAHLKYVQSGPGDGILSLFPILPSG